MAKDRATRSGAPKARSQTRPRTAAQKLAASKRKAEQAAENPKTGKQRREKQRREAQARAEAAAAEKAKRDERIAARKAHRQEFFDSIRERESVSYTSAFAATRQHHSTKGTQKTSK